MVFVSFYVINFFVCIFINEYLKKKLKNNYVLLYLWLKRIIEKLMENDNLNIIEKYVYIYI